MTTKSISNLCALTGGFGLLAFAPLGQGQILINEVDADTPGSDTAEFVELFNAGISGVPLNGLSLVFFNGNGDISYFALDLDPSVTLQAGQFYVVGNPGVANAQQTFAPGTQGLLQNGADAVALFNAPASSFPNATPVTDMSLLDAVVYGTADAADDGLLSILTPGQPQVDEGAGVSTGDPVGVAPAVSIGRFPNGFGAQRQTDTYMQLSPTPGTFNVIPEPSAAILGALGVLALLGRRRRA